MAQAAHASLEDSAAHLHSSPEVVRRLQRTYAEAHSDDEPDYRALRLALIEVKRAALVQLRDQREIDDIVLTERQVRLDREEVTPRPDVRDD